MNIVAKGSFLGIIGLILGFLLMTSCTSSGTIQSPGRDPWMIDKQTFRISTVSLDEGQGFDKAHPMNIGAGHPGDSLNIQYYFNALEGPENEEVHWYPINKCCDFELPGVEGGIGQLQFFELYHDNSPEPQFIYLNIWKSGSLIAPFGYSFKTEPTKD